MLFATAAMASQSQSSTTARVQAQDLSLKGTGKLSQWLVLLSRVDNSPALVCNDVQLTLYGSVKGHQDFAELVRASGVVATGPGPWRYNCGEQRNGSGPVASSMPLGSPLEAALPFQASQQLVAPATPATAPASPPSTYQVFAEGGDTLVDRLAQNGFAPMGCIETDSGIRVSMKGPDRTQTVSLEEVRRSKISDLVRCRL